MKRILTRIGLVGLLGLLGFLVFLWLTTPSHRIDQTSFDKIAKGMSLHEVQLLLRCPPGKYCSSSAKVEFRCQDGSPCGIAVDEICDPAIQPDGLRPTFWAGDQGVIVVLLDADDKVAEKQFAKMYAEDFLTSVRKWLASIL